MQPWSPPENGLVLTDLLRRGPQQPQQQQQQLREAVYVKPEPNFVSSRPGMVDLPPLLPPRAPALPAFSDVLRTTSPQQQRYQYENAMATNRVPASDTPDAGYSLPAATRDSYSTDQSATYSATFMTRPNASEFAKPDGFVLQNGPTSGPYAAATGDTTPPGMAGARTRPIGDGSPSPRETTARPASRTCRFAGCTHYVVDHGLCVRHGGGKRCTAEGCSSRAKHFGRCWRHGGSIECKAPGCSNRAKSRGYCWSHGGGTKCKTGACEKIAISNGLCWAHGGGKRCIVPGCRKQAYERTCNYCNSHFQQYQQTALELARHQPSA